MKIVAICQARLGSTRLPNKMLLPLAGAPLVQRVLERVSRSQSLAQIVLAFPEADAESFWPIVQANPRWSGYSDMGDEADLVGRYLKAARHYRADLIVRIPCDNPCVQAEYIDEAIATYRHCDVTFYSNTTARYAGQYIDGLGAEVFSFNRLTLLDELTRGQALLREHPHRYFDYILPHADIRLDVNTQADYDFIADIYDHCYPRNEQFTIADILAYLDTKKVPA